MVSSGQTSKLSDPPHVHGSPPLGNSAGDLCPVCGMSTDGSHMVSVEGEQTIYTCSLTHATNVFDDIVRFVVVLVRRFYARLRDQRPPR